MKDAFGEIIAIVIVVLGLFIVPMVYVGQKQDAILQSFVYYQTVQFVENVEKNGYLSQTMYDDFSRQLASCEVLFDIKMEHKHDVIEPVFNDDGSAVTGTDVYTSAKYEEDILDDLYANDGVYRFRKGDYFTVTVTNSSKTAGQQINKIVNQVSSKYAVYVVFGGAIRSENY